MYTCHFCGAGAPGNYAMTSLKGNPKRIGSWRRHVLAACPRCHRLLLAAGLEGRKLKATGEVWYAGHGLGRFDSPGAPPKPVDTRHAQAHNRATGSREKTDGSTRSRLAAS